MKKNLLKNLFFLLVVLSVVNLSFAQNLVPNPSFEDTLGCPQGYPNLDGVCKDWMTFRITPDYMNNCSSVCGYDNQFGYQEPHAGQAYMGFATYQVTNSTAREHIGAQLTSPLVIGTKYYVSFYVSPAWNNLLTNIATNKIGALVTTYQYSDPNGTIPMPNTCTVYSDSIIKDTLSWRQIFGSFIADSTYQYLVIGNFFDDIFVDTIHFPYQAVPQIAYYYLDDVCLSPDSVYAQTWTSINESKKSNSNKLLVYPNPASDFIYIKSFDLIQQVEIINSLGQLVYTSAKENDTEVNLSVGFLKAGIYYLRIKSNQEFYNSLINIIH